MQTVNLPEAKSQLSALVQAVPDGGDLVTAKTGTPVVRLVQFQAAPAQRVPGRLRGRILMAGDFDTVDREIAGGFEQGR